MIDGNAATLVDLSTVGAQVVSPTILKPNQRVRMALPDDQRQRRAFNAAVAWASFEIPPKSGPALPRRHRRSSTPTTRPVDAFCDRHKTREPGSDRRSDLQSESAVNLRLCSDRLP